MKKNILLICTLFLMKTIFTFSQWEGGIYKPKKEIIKEDIFLNSVKEKNTKELIKKIKKLKNKETLIIPDGEYKNLGTIKIKQKDIKILAENPGKVIFSGKIQFIIEGDNNIFSGFTFINGGPENSSGVFNVLGNKNEVSNNSFIDFNLHEEKECDWITLKGTKNKILNNYFEGKSKRGQIIVISRELEKEPGHIIAQNIFKNHKAKDNVLKDEANGWEVIRTGTGKTSLYKNSKIEIVYNLFINMDAEPELISVKSSDTLVKGNTVISSIAGITLRQGRNNIVEDNVILGMDKKGTRGIRFYDKGHTIRNNYIEGLKGRGDAVGGLVSATGVVDTRNKKEIGETIENSTSQWTPNNILIENNSFINSDQNILYSEKIHSPNSRDNLPVEKVYPGYKLHFKNNLSYEERAENFALLGSDSMNPLDSTYENEIYFGTIKDFSISSKGIDTKKPSLKRKGGILEVKDKDAGAKNLIILTENMIGPSYRIKKN